MKNDIQGKAERAEGMAPLKKFLREGVRAPSKRFLPSNTHACKYESESDYEWFGRVSLARPRGRAGVPPPPGIEAHREQSPSLKGGIIK